MLVRNDEWRIFAKGFYNYNAKYDENGSFHKIPADIPKIIYDKAMSWALRAHQIIGCKGISRTDFRYDAKEKKLYIHVWLGNNKYH